MKIAVVGGGGVGGYIAAKLSKVCQVDLISSSLLKLRVKEKDQTTTYDLPIYPTPPKKSRYEAVIFACKSYQLEQKVKLIQHHINPDTIILPLLNGIEPYEWLKNSLNAHMIKGAIYIISNRKGDLIELKGKGAMVVMQDCGPKCQELAKCFEKAGMKVKMPKEIDKAIWQKYLFIAATAALTTLYGKTFGEIAKEHLKEFEKLLNEIASVAKNQGVMLNESDIKQAVLLLQKSPPEAKTSMQLDCKQNSKSELDNLIGYLAKRSPLFQQIYTQLISKCR